MASAIAAGAGVVAVTVGGTKTVRVADAATIFAKETMEALGGAEEAEDGAIKAS